MCSAIWYVGRYLHILEQLKQGLEELLKQGAFEDKIKANQIKWFISNLENFILKLNK